MKRILLIFTMFAGLFTTASAQNFYSVKDPIPLYQGDAPGSEGLVHDQGLTLDAMGQRITVNVTEPTNIWPKFAYNFMIKTGFIKGNYME